ncbi:MAG: alpha/beta fold hydrolase [Anaerolineae bacterium]|nr:alpha/beta fold hydrolase [Anaerolineae bacterium]
MPEERFFDSGGVPLQTLDWGGAGRPLVLLAGLGDTAHLYRGLAPRLASRFRVVGLTRRGHGRSGKPESGYNLDTLVQDIRRFLDALDIERSILVGHSFAGLEMPLFAIQYPQRVEAIVYLDALFPRLDPEPDLSGDPTWSAIPTGGPTAEDLASREAYLAYYKRARPAWARIWCEAIEADLMDKVTVEENGQIAFHHDDELMNQIYREVWPARNPDYGRVEAPMLAIVPDGHYHQGVPLDATEEFRLAADRYWEAVLLPWIRQRTAVFHHAAPSARIVELDSPYHHIYIAEEDRTLQAIQEFL